MKKLLYIASVYLEDEYLGITRKVYSQWHIFGETFEAYLLGYYQDGLALFVSDKKKIIEKKKFHCNISKKIYRRLAIKNLASTFVIENDIDNVYIRRMLCTPFSIGMLKKIKKKSNAKIVWEIPTYPYDSESDSLTHRIRILIDKIWRKKLHKYVDKIVTFGNDQNIFGIPTINTNNGIIVANIKPREISEHGDEIHLIAAAVVQRWHGYDRLIKGLSQYYKSTNKRKVFFHMVGDGPCLNEYKNLAKTLNLNDKVIFYGYKSKEDLDKIYDQCDLAVESLGWHRSNVKVGTSIKTKEYVAKGFPIIASTPIDIFPDGWEYAYYAPIDDTPIDINAVINFYDDVLRNTSKEELVSKIRSISYQKCDMKNMLQLIIDFFE